MAIKKTISRYPDKSYDTFPENLKTARFVIKYIPFYNCWRKKKKFLKKACFVLKKGISCIFLVIKLELLEEISFEEIMKMFTAEEFVKARQFSEPTT